jgi:hypothetical protein
MYLLTRIFGLQQAIPGDLTRCLIIMGILKKAQESQNSTETLPKAKLLFYLLFLKKTNNFADGARKG